MLPRVILDPVDEKSARFIIHVFKFRAVFPVVPGVVVIRLPYYLILMIPKRWGRESV